MGAAPIRDLPVIKPAQLPEFDGFIFGASCPLARSHAAHVRLLANPTCASQRARR